MRSIVIVLVLVAVAHADTAKSYAYVTKVNGYRTGTREHPHDHCDIVAKLPKTDLAAQPAGSDLAPLGSDALVVGETTDDDNDICDRLLHTWLAVRFDSADRSAVHFRAPDPGWTISRVLVLIAIALGIGALVRDRIAKRRAKREQAAKA
ncbi:MAG TPA: hypothetical protein VH143_29535 [Kofleriaceae bacterium]|jgi:hypothetical protein|nr:hypothetical protein [Kofleriaceae bacterium]